MTFKDVSPQQKVKRVLATLNYDFRQFSLEHFIKHVAAYRGKPIVCLAVPLEPDLQGMWLRTETTDYIVINANLHDIHQIHTMLHEVGHVVLGHTPGTSDDIINPTVLTAFKAKHDIPMQVQPLFRSMAKDRWQDDQEQEAELFVRVIQQEVIVRDRQQYLTAKSTSITALEELIRCLT